MYLVVRPLRAHLLLSRGEPRGSALLPGRFPQNSVSPDCTEMQQAWKNGGKTKACSGHVMSDGEVRKLVVGGDKDLVG